MNKYFSIDQGNLALLAHKVRTYMSMVFNISKMDTWLGITVIDINDCASTGAKQNVWPFQHITFLSLLMEVIQLNQTFWLVLEFEHFVVYILRFIFGPTLKQKLLAYIEPRFFLFFSGLKKKNVPKKPWWLHSFFEFESQLLIRGALFRNATPNN